MLHGWYLIFGFSLITGATLAPLKLKAQPSLPESAQTCVACHGQNGISPNDLWPNIKGQKRGYIVKSLNAYQADKRYDPLMTPIAKTLTQKDIEALADFYSRL